MTQSIPLKVNQVSISAADQANLLVTHYQLAVGISELRKADGILSANMKDIAANLEMLGRASVGLICLAQGFENLLMALMEAMKLEPKDPPQKDARHDLASKFRAIAEAEPSYYTNLQALSGGTLDAAKAEAFFSQLSKAFFPARYFGKKGRSSLPKVSGHEAGIFGVALAVTFPTLDVVALKKAFDNAQK